MSTTATFVINFGSDGAFLHVELDADRNNEKTTFSPGDMVHFKVYASTDYSIEVSAGTINNGTVDKQETISEEILSFVKGAAVTSAKKISSIESTTWFGNNLGALSVVGSNSVQAANADDDSLGIASVDYISEYNEHSIVSPSMSGAFHIIVYVKAEG